MAIKGYNTLVQIKDAGGTYRELYKCKQTDIFGMDRAELDVTPLRADHSEKDTGIASTNNLKMDVIYDDTDATHSVSSQYGLQYLVKFDIECDIKVTLASGKFFEYRGKFKTFAVTGAQVNGIVMASTEFMPTVAPLNQ